MCHTQAGIFRAMATCTFILFFLWKASTRTAKEWIDQALITISKLQLKHSKEPVNWIADVLSFPNYSFFSKFLRHLIGNDTDAIQGNKLNGGVSMNISNKI